MAQAQEAMSMGTDADNNGTSSFGGFSSSGSGEAPSLDIPEPEKTVNREEIDIDDI